MAAYRFAFPDAHFALEDQIVEADKVVSRWTARSSRSKVSCQLGRWLTNMSGPMDSGASTSALRVPQAKSSVRGLTLRSGSHTFPTGHRLAIEMPYPSSMSPPRSASRSVWWARW